MSQENGTVTPTTPTPAPEPAPLGGKSSRMRSMRRLWPDPRRDAVKILAVLAVVLLANLVFHFGVLRPQGRTVADLETEKSTFDTTYRRAEARARDVRDSYERAVLIRDQLEEFYSHRMSTARERLGRTQEEILRIGDKYKTIPDPLAFDPKELEDEAVEQLSISFPLQGGYENLRSFVRDMESSRELLIIEQIALSENRAAGRGLRLSINVTTYFDAPHLAQIREASGPAARGSRRR